MSLARGRYWHTFIVVYKGTRQIVVVFVKTPPMGATATSKFASKSCSSLAQTRSPAAIFVPLFIHDGRGHHEDGQLRIQGLGEERIGFVGEKVETPKHEFHCFKKFPQRMMSFSSINTFSNVSVNAKTYSMHAHAPTCRQ